MSLALCSGPIAPLSRVRVGTLLDSFLYFVGKSGPFHRKIDLALAYFAACGRGQALSFGTVFATLRDEFFGGQTREFRVRKLVTQHCRPRHQGNQISYLGMELIRGFRNRLWDQRSSPIRGQNLPSPEG